MDLKINIENENFIVFGKRTDFNPMPDKDVLYTGPAKGLNKAKNKASNGDYWLLVSSAPKQTDKHINIPICIENQRISFVKI